MNRAWGICTNCCVVRLPSCTSCFQRGFFPITRVPIPSLTNRSMMRRLAVCRELSTRRLRITRDPIQLTRGETVLVAQAALVLCALFMVQLVEAFQGLAADQAGDKTRFVEGRGRPEH